MVSTSLDGSKVFARVARELAMQPDIAKTAHHLVHCSTALTGCDVAALWELRFGTLASLRACTDESLGRVLSSIQDEVGEGPAPQALADRSTCLMADVDREGRWPGYVAAIRNRGLPLRSALAFPLDLGGQDLGALVLYSGRPGYFSDDLIEVGGVIADHATLALHAAGNAVAATQLRRALDSNRRIGMALGVLMALQQITEDQAFSMMRSASQSRHVKLRQIAEDVILTGAIPESPSHCPAA